jgi:hypothetical protein
MAGHYGFASTDANLDEGSTTLVFGTANSSYAAHASVVIGGAGSVDTGVVGLRATGTSINDSGIRVPSDSETLTSDITSLVLNEYLETSKKWIGQVTFELFTVSGAPTVFSLDFNYGLTKYDDFGNLDFIVTDLECVGRSGSSDPGFDIALFHHNDQGWTYAAAGFVPGGEIIARMSVDHGAESDLINNERFAYKRSNLDTFINGADSEGVILCVLTTSGGAVEIMDAHIGVIDG